GGGGGGRCGRGGGRGEWGWGGWRDLPCWRRCVSRRRGRSPLWSSARPASRRLRRRRSNALALRHHLVAGNDVARDGETLRQLDQQEQHYPEDGQRNNTGEQQLRIHAPVRDQKEIAKPGIAAYKLADHGSHHG